jgi:voltage-gated potassium channel
VSSPVPKGAEARRERRQERLERRIRHTVATRRAFFFLAFATLVLTIVVGILVTIIDERDFHNVGDGLWWAIVTLGTVGYGDIVPHTTWGRIIGTIVIIFGVTFIAFLTALVTSAFVSAEQDERTVAAEKQRASDLNETTALLQELLDRVGAVERKLDR